MFAKSAKLAVVLGLAAIGLTACTPPMPPEVKAALAEQTHTCVSGNAKVAAGEAMGDALPGINDAMGAACAGMTLAPVALSADSKADIWIDAASATAAECKPELTAPYALDAAVLTATLGNASGLILSPETAAAILTGSITNWSDPKITADNGGVALDNEPIILNPVTDAATEKAFAAWYGALTGKKFDASKLKVQPSVSASDLGEFPEGSVALIPFSTFTLYSVNAMVPPVAASILLNASTQEQAVPDLGGIGSAGTQLVAKKAGASVSVAMDFKAKPIPAQGSDVATTPYGAIYPVNISLCATSGSKATKVAHAVARYMLRQDAQGNLTNYVVLPEAVRAVSLDAVSVGLPEPKLPTTK